MRSGAVFELAPQFTFRALLSERLENKKDSWELPHRERIGLNPVWKEIAEVELELSWHGFAAEHSSSSVQDILL